METITSDLKVSMKARNKFRTGVLRMVLSEFKYAATSGVKSDMSLDDEVALKILASYQKRLTKSLSDYPDGDKKDAIKSEIAIVAEYLPQKAGQDEVVAAVNQLFEDTEERQFGVLMKSLMVKFGNKADGSLISAELKKKLQG